MAPDPAVPPCLRTLVVTLSVAISVASVDGGDTVTDVLSTPTVYPYNFGADLPGVALWCGGGSYSDGDLLDSLLSTGAARREAMNTAICMRPNA